MCSRVNVVSDVGAQFVSARAKTHRPAGTHLLDYWRRRFVFLRNKYLKTSRTLRGRIDWLVSEDDGCARSYHSSGFCQEVSWQATFLRLQKHALVRGFLPFSRYLDPTELAVGVSRL